MKVGLITFHFVSNHGGVLQCFASQTFLEREGYEVEIIDYRPSYHVVRYSAHKNPFQYARWYWKRFKTKSFFRQVVLTTRSFARCVYLNLKGTDKETAKQFNIFIENKLKLTKRYKTYKELQMDPPHCDAYVCGSDQLWNPEVLDYDFDPAYFLSFGNANIPHISYAVSTGRALSNEEQLKVKELCKGLSAVSLREYNEQIIKTIEKDVHVCIDPTLLLDEMDYASIEADNEEPEPYIFVYGFENSEEIHKALIAAKKMYHCKIINGSPHRIHLKVDALKLRDYGPDKFLTLIKNAQCIVTNSFHGTAFSIIYKKNFITVSHSSRGGRMIELLRKLGLTSRLWNSPEFQLDQVISYDKVYEKLIFLYVISYRNTCLFRNNDKFSCRKYKCK